MRGRWRHRIETIRAVVLAFSFQLSSNTSMDTFGSSRKRRTGSGGAFRKHSTHFHPHAPSCADSLAREDFAGADAVGRNQRRQRTVLFLAKVNQRGLIADGVDWGTGSVRPGV